jgi:hypothetical protein
MNRKKDNFEFFFQNKSLNLVSGSNFFPVHFFKIIPSDFKSASNSGFLYTHFDLYKEEKHFAFRKAFLYFFDKKIQNPQYEG